MAPFVTQTLCASEARVVANCGQRWLHVRVAPCRATNHPGTPDTVATNHPGIPGLLARVATRTLDPVVGEPQHLRFALDRVERPLVRRSLQAWWAVRLRGAAEKAVERDRGGQRQELRRDAGAQGVQARVRRGLRGRACPRRSTRGAVGWRTVRVRAALGDVAQRVVGLAVRQLVDELVQALLDRHAPDCKPPDHPTTAMPGGRRATRGARALGRSAPGERETAAA
jgi:hypothetical protein